MHVQLSNGREVSLNFSHYTYNEKKFNFSHETVCILKVFKGGVLDTTIDSKSFCSKKDSFVKKEGRRISYIRLIEKVKDKGLLNRYERQLLTKKVPLQRRK